MARPHPHKRAARLAAIFILSVLGAVAAVWVAPRVSPAVETWMSAPPVELRTAKLPAALPVGPADASTAGRGAATAEGAAQAPAGDAVVASAATVDPGMRFTMAGVTCAPPARIGEVQVLLRTSEDGQTWSRWYAVALERVAEEGGEEQAFTEPVWTGGGRYLQLTAQAAGGAEPVPVSLQDVGVVAINSTEDADRATAVVGVLRRTAAALAGIRLTDDAAAMTTRPPIVSRADWGANESWRSGQPDYAPVKMAFVHHTDSGNGYTAAESPAIMRGIYAYHTQLAALERRRLQLPDRPLRHHLRRPLRRRRPRRHRRPGPRLQHGKHGHLRDRYVHRRHTAVARGHLPRAPARVEARRPPRRSAGHGDPDLRLRPEVRDRPARDVPGHRRPS